MCPSDWDIDLSPIQKDSEFADCFPADIRHLNLRTGRAPRLVVITAVTFALLRSERTKTGVKTKKRKPLHMPSRPRRNRACVQFSQ